MVFSEVGASNEGAGEVGEIGDGTHHSSGAEGFDQTNHCKGMTETGTVVNIVSAQETDQLLKEVVFLIVVLGRG